MAGRPCNASPAACSGARRRARQVKRRRLRLERVSDIPSQSHARRPRGEESRNNGEFLSYLLCSASCTLTRTRPTSLCCVLVLLSLTLSTTHTPSAQPQAHASPSRPFIIDTLFGRCAYGACGRKDAPAHTPPGRALRDGLPRKPPSPSPSSSAHTSSSRLALLARLARPAPASSYS